MYVTTPTKILDLGPDLGQQHERVCLTGGSPEYSTYSPELELTNEVNLN